jgi:hypothetical protein
MSGSKGTEFKTLIVKGDDTRFYAIPVSVLQQYACSLNANKLTLLEGVFQDAQDAGNTVDAFYYDREVVDDSTNLAR